MIYLYILLYILGNIFIVYTIDQYYGLLFRHRSMGQSVCFLCYAVFYFAFTVLHFTSLPFFDRLWLYLLLLFLFSFVYESALLKRVGAVLLLSTLLLALNLGLIFLSARFSLQLFYPPYFNSIIGFLLFDVSAYIAVLLMKFIGDRFQRKNTHFTYWLSAFLLPMNGIYLLSLAIIAREKDLGFAFYMSAFILIAVTVLAVYSHNRISRLSLMEMQNIMYENQFEMMQNMQQTIKTIRHDIRNHLASVDSLIKRGQYEEAESYIQKTTGALDYAASVSSTGNTVLDAIINYKLSRLDPKIKLRYEASVPKDLSISPFDLTVILGNLIDNAVEAVEKVKEGDREISVTIKYDRGRLLIAIRNTYDGILTTNGQEVLTRKANASFHGIGLKHVREIVEKAQGVMDFSFDGHVFRVSVILYLS